MLANNTTRRLLSEAEAAKYCGVSRGFLRRTRMEGLRGNHTPGPPFIRLGGGRGIRYDIRDLDGWIDQHRHEMKRPLDGAHGT